jgi:hypothetical protein
MAAGSLTPCRPLPCRHGPRPPCLAWAPRAALLPLGNSLGPWRHLRPCLRDGDRLTAPRGRPATTEPVDRWPMAKRTKTKEMKRGCATWARQRGARGAPPTEAGPCAGQGVRAAAVGCKPPARSIPSPPDAEARPRLSAGARGPAARPAAPDRSNPAVALLACRPRSPGADASPLQEGGPSNPTQPSAQPPPLPCRRPRSRG